MLTLVSLIIMQDGINVQAGKIPKINKRAGWNFSFFISKNRGFGLKFPKINKRAGWNKAVQDGIFQKINKICCMIIRETRVCPTAKDIACPFLGSSL